MTSVPHSSTASVPATSPKSRKTDIGAGKMKILSPLRFKELEYAQVHGTQQESSAGPEVAGKVSTIFEKLCPSSKASMTGKRDITPDLKKMCQSLTLAQHQTPTRVTHSPSSVTARQQRGEKVNKCLMSEIRTGRNTSRAKLAQLTLQSEFYY